MHHTSTCVLINHKFFIFLNIWEFVEKLMAGNIKVFTYSINRFITSFLSFLQMTQLPEVLQTLYLFFGILN